MAITWQVLIDEDDDWTYGENITTRVFAFDAWLGSEERNVRVAPPCRAEFQCYNGDDYFTPGAAAQGPVLVGRFIRIRATSGVTTRTLWTGVIRQISVDAETLRAKLVCSGRMASVGGAIPFETMRDVTADVIIQYVLDRVDMPRKLVSSSGPYWILGRGELGTSTVLASGTAEDVDLGTGNPGEGGITTFELVGNHYTQPLADVVIDDAVRADWGWLYEDSGGLILFLNRHQVLSFDSASFEAVGTAHAFASGPVQNQVEIVLSPTYITEDDTLWTLNAPMRFTHKRNQRRVHFRDTDGRAIALDGGLTEPVDWTVYRSQTGSVPVSKAKVTVTPDATGAYVDVKLPKHQDDGWLYAGIELVGDAIHQDQPVTVFAQNNYSVLRHGRSTFKTRLPNYADVNYAGDLAQFVVAQFPLDRGILAWIDIVDDLHQITIFPFDVVQVTIPGLDLVDTLYLVLGTWQRLVAGELTTRLYLEWVGFDHFWRLGRNRLNQDTYLAF